MSKSGERYKSKKAMMRHEKGESKREEMMEYGSMKTKMPLTKKGKKIMSAMQKEYGKERGQRVFYASANAGKIKGVEGRKKR